MGIGQVPGIGGLAAFRRFGTLPVPFAVVNGRPANWRDSNPDRCKDVPPQAKWHGYYREFTTLSVDVHKTLRVPVT